MMEDENSVVKSYNFLINSANQANLANTKDIKARQVNSVFVLITPYYIDRFNLAGLDLDISIDEHGTLWVNEQSFEAIEIARGVKIIGIIQR
ncbi:MAG: hypothetical protein GX893_04485 [Firmicutes bacterium]|nr:hypothetical protein [Bacillota bacterium]